MKIFLELENKMGPIIPALVSQFRPSLPESNPNLEISELQTRGKEQHLKRRLGKPPPGLL